MKFFFKTIFLITAVFFLIVFSAPQVFAVNFLPLVPCGLSAENVARLKAEGKGDPNIDYSLPCTRCDTFRLVKNTIDFTLYGIVPPVAAVLFIAGGLIIVLAGARPEWILIGRKVFWNTFIGLVVIFSAWLVVNTFIKSFGPEQVKDSWYKFTCTQKPEQTIIIGPGGISLPPGAACSNPQSLAQYLNVPLPNNFPRTPGVNAPELEALIFCVNSRLRNVIDQSQLYTYERSNPLCNLTKGSSVCGACAHRVNSCHYGGPGGTQGSLAIDFNAVPGVSEALLFRELKAIRDAGNPCDFGFILFEGDYTHVSTTSCAGDTGGD